MPVYRVQGPDGKVYRVEGPAGASADQLGEFILSANVGALDRPPVDQSVLDPNDARAKQPAPEATGMQKFMASAPGRFVQGGLDVIDAGAQMLSRLGPEGESAKVDAINKDRAQRFDQARKATGFDGVDLARPLGSAALQIAALRGFTPAATTMPAKIGLGAAQGSVFGALQPVEDTENFGTEKAKQMGLGAATGAVAAPVAEGLARVIRPLGNPAVDALKEAGVRLTPGQILGGGFKAAEEKAQSLPILGSAISAAKDRAVGDLNRAAFDRALKPIGEKLPKGVVGRDAVEFTAEKLSQSYDDVLGKIGAISPDQKMVQEFNRIGGSIANLPKDKLEQFVRVLQNEVAGRIERGALSAEALKAAESNLGQISRGYLKSADYDQRMLGRALQESQTALREAVERQAPQYAKELKGVNTGWANFLRAQRASTSVAAENGVFTPAQLHNSVKALDSSRNKSAFAKGNALMQDLSEPAKSVMQDTVRNSGTADRALQAGLLASLLSHPLATVKGAVGALPAAAMYSRPGVAAMDAILTSRPQVADPIAEIVRRNSLPLSSALYPTAYSLLNSGK